MSEIPDFKLIRSHRRTLSIQITRDGELVVKAPIFLPAMFIKRFVLEKKDWIHKHLVQKYDTSTRQEKKYQEGEEFMYLGKKYLLHIGKFKEISLTDTLNFPDFLLFRIEKELTNWYIKQAKKLITERVEYYAKLMNADFTSIMFSDTISKWGSCSRDNSLQFNWRLIMAPILVIDYVVVHELVHTWEKNHGRKFWSKVGIYKPAYKQYRKWLNENSRKLHVQVSGI